MVANGASELFIEVFEERGPHARSAVGVSQIPFGCCVEIEMVVRHLYRKVHANCEMHTQKKQSGYEPKSFAVPGRTMMGA